MQVRARIAPTPSGYLHMGNILNFVITWLWVRKANGVLRLRIDDGDAVRTRPEYIADIFDSLNWLGIDYDEGPRSVTELEEKYSQKLRINRYNELIEKLLSTGRIFACSCSRKDLAGISCNCFDKQLPLDAADFAWRINTSGVVITLNDVKGGKMQIDLDKEMKNFVIKRRDGIPSYQISSLADDIDFNINLIIRGKDLIVSSAAQLYLASLLNEPEFVNASFYHHGLLLDKNGGKLSKSGGSQSIMAMRKAGLSQEEFYVQLSEAMNLSPAYFSLKQMQEIKV